MKKIELSEIFVETNPVPSDVYLDDSKANLAPKKPIFSTNTSNLSFCCRAQTKKEPLITELHFTSGEIQLTLLDLDKRKTKDLTR